MVVWIEEKVITSSSTHPASLSFLFGFGDSDHNSPLQPGDLGPVASGTDPSSVPLNVTTTIMTERRTVQKSSQVVR